MDINRNGIRKPKNLKRQKKIKNIIIYVIIMVWGWIAYLGIYNPESEFGLWLLGLLFILSAIITVLYMIERSRI